MTELAAWLLEQIAEDETIAQAACLKGHPSWHNENGPLGDYDVTDDAARLIVSEMVNMPNQAVHIARWDPTRVLAECDVKRRIIAEHTVFQPPPEVAPPTPIIDCPWCIVEPPCPTLRLLALPFADREGYREEWKP